MPLIYIVEDDDSIREIETIALKNSNYIVRSFGCASDFFKKIGEILPDLVLLDTLKGTDDRAENDMGPVEGTIDPAQLAWFEKFVSEAKRPFFVGSHQFRDLYIEGAKPIARAAKSAFFSGWLYGHDHSWCPDIAVASWGKHLICPTLALPSTGLWGDIGYVVFRTDADGATAELVQSDFYFQTPTAHAVRPRFWASRVQENQGKSMRFVFEK